MTNDTGAITDGDAVFAMARGIWEWAVERPQLTRLGAAAAKVMAKAILRAVTQAADLDGVPAVKELGYS